MSLFEITDTGDMIADGETPTWTGRAPLRFTPDYYTPAELDAAYDQFQLEFNAHGYMGVRERGMGSVWRRARCGGSGIIGNGHRIDEFSTDLRCGLDEHRPWKGGCSCMGDIYHQIICEPCGWHRIGTEREVVAWWHDHAWPGWRDLPLLPYELRTEVWMFGAAKSKKIRAWVDANVPAEWQAPGAPLLTAREEWGTRNVPGYSPWGGYSIAEQTLAVAA